MIHKSQHAALCRLRLFPVEGVDILGSSVAEQQRRIVRRKSQPTTPEAGKDKILQVHRSFSLAVAEANPDHSSAHIGKSINPLSVLRPTQPAERALGKLRPFLSLEIKPQQS